jgi:radical SAM protein with 4Fe4S-binding SPASM domain
MRGQKAFEHCLEMIRHAVTQRSELTSRTGIGLNHTLTKINHHELADVFNLADTLGVDSVSVLSLSLLGNAALHKDELYLSEREELTALQKGATALRKINIGRQIKGLNPLTFNVELYPYTWKCRLMDRLRHLVSYVSQHICASGTETIYVTADGTIFPCEAARPALDALERILGPYERPNISEYTIAEAKQTESFKKIVTFLHNYDQVFSSIRPCNTCGHLGKCTICPLSVLAEGEVRKCTEEVLSHV